eukprot:778212-Prymnesium_polylepis.1
MEKAKAALNGLHKRDVGEFKGLASPPAAAVNVTAALAYMLAPKGSDLKKVDVTWGGAKKMIGDVQKFIERLKNFDVAEFPMENKAKVLEYTGVTSDGLTDPNNPEFNYEYMKSKSSCAAGLCDWVVNICASRRFEL